MQGNLLHKHRHTAKQNVRHKKLFIFPECAKLCESYPALTHVARTTNSLLNIHMCVDLCAHSQPYSLTYNIQQFKRYETVQGCDAVSVAWRSDGLLPFSPALCARGGTQYPGLIWDCTRERRGVCSLAFRWVTDVRTSPLRQQCLGTITEQSYDFDNINTKCATTVNQKKTLLWQIWIRIWIEIPMYTPTVF